MRYPRRGTAVPPGLPRPLIQYPFSRMGIQKRAESCDDAMRVRKQAAGDERRERQHAEGKLSARERIDLLLDEGTFEEMDKLVRHRCRDFGMEEQVVDGDGFITGHGLIHGRPAFCLRAGLYGLRRFAFGDRTPRRS